MKRSRFLAVAGGALSAASLPGFAVAAPVESDVVLETSSGKIYGTLSMPVAQLPVPAVLIIAGSGPTDRDGNSPLLPGKSDTYKILAQDLAARGIASVRYDKRGVGQSVGAIPVGGERNLRFDSYIDDAAAWASEIVSDRRFSGAIVAGHSEGSLIGMVAAQRTHVKAFVSLEGAGRPAPTVLSEQLKGQLSAAAYAQAETAFASLEAGKTVLVDASSPLAASPAAQIFRQSVQPYLISWFAHDPAVEIAKLRCPVTIVQGTADVQVSMSDATALAKAAPHAKLVVVQGMNHLLRYAPDTSSQAAVIAGYTNPALPIEPHVVRAVVEAAQTTTSS